MGCFLRNLNQKSTKSIDRRTQNEYTKDIEKEKTNGGTYGKNKC